MKRRIKQALTLRDSTNFNNVNEYQLFIDNIVQKYNKKNYESIKYEKTYLLDLPLLKACDYTEMTALVASTSTIRVKNTVYSVPSRLIGENLRIHLYDNRLSCYLGSEHLFDFPRIRCEAKTIKKVINYKHLIKSLYKKPEAFARSALKEDILSSQDYIDIWHYLEDKCEKQQACKIIVGILQLADETNKEKEIALFVKEIISNNKIPYLELLRKKFKCFNNTKKIVEIKIEQHELKSYNMLITAERVK